MEEKMDAGKVTAALQSRHSGDGWAYFSELRTKTGFSGHVGYIDGYAVGMWADNRSFISYEIKVSRQDFKHDVEKFVSKQEAALRNSTQFYYVCPQGLIKVEEIPEVAGLMYVNEGGCRIQKVAPVRELKDGNLDLGFIRALMRATAGAPDAKTSLWKYMGKEMTKEDVIVLATEIGKMHSETTVKHLAKEMAAKQRQRSYAILKKFAEAVGLGQSLGYGTIEEEANRMVKAYRDNYAITQQATTIMYNAKQIAANAQNLMELVEKKNAEANR